MRSKTCTSGRTGREDGSYERCRICGQSWNVSAETEYRPGEYTCPACAKKKRRNEAEIPKRLRQLRERRGVASYVVSELCGFSRDTLRRYELGTQVPGAEALAALADFYGVTTDWLLGRE